ncbi:MAG: PASTA domain-containing protein, partial [Oscillospiraceae bacterium]|jgi:stage V sporulation protein D (sporulation-specific penicillin-binding protein)|nr:PASTA domain-containing protein [Oscillospiraceae bacterium]
MLVRKRLIWLAMIITLLFCAVLVRVGRLTIVDAEELTQRGVAQWTRSGTITADRGAILDRNGEVLARNATAYIVSASPRLVKDAEALCDLICPLLQLEREDVLAKLSNKSVATVTLKRQVSRAMVDTLRDLAAETGALTGITFDQDSLRFYPQGSALSQVIGLTTIDGVGQSGLEQLYDEYLAGTPGRIITETDQKGRTLADGETTYIPAAKGADVKLTIDSNIQSIVERALRECIEVNGANRVMAIAMDPNTAQVLGMAIHPSFDPNEPPRSDLTALQEGMRIQLISDVYEPGSTFKVLTSAAALDSGVTHPAEGFFCSGSITVNGDRIRCWKNSHGAESMAKALNNSCNPVFTELALRMGTENFYRYLYAFGLGAQTGVDLPGESGGLLINRKYVKDVDLARIGFGQSVTVTPLQLITAVSAVVNGGRLMRPYIVEEVVSQDGETLSRTLPKVVSTPISEKTSATMRELLESVVADGGARNAAIDGYRVGGKTGTAQVYKNGQIVHDVHIGSFVGFAPADNPQVAVLVIVDEARLMPDYGGTTAAPFARQILEETLQYLGVPKQGNEATAMATVPGVTGLTVAEAEETLKAAGYKSMTNGSETTVIAQMPAQGAEMAQGSLVMLYVNNDPPPDVQEYVLVPDVSGLSILEATRQLQARNLVLSLEGSGLAVGQRPAAGAFVAPGSTVKVTFEAQGGFP